VVRLSVEDRRSALVDAALTVVAERGVHAATTRAIVAEAGMSLASFHYAFSSRDELMAELVNRVVDGERTALIPPAPPGASLRDTVRLGLQRYFDHLRHDPQREKAMFELTHYALRSPELEALAKRQYERYFALAQDALRVAADRWHVSWSWPPDRIAKLLVVFTDGLTIAWLVTRDDEAATTTMDFAADELASLAVSA
jgi:AcrR family transcriptional regulator